MTPTMDTAHRYGSIFLVQVFTSTSQKFAVQTF